MEYYSKDETELTEFYNKLVQIEQTCKTKIIKSNESNSDSILNQLIYKLISSSISLTLNILTENLYSTGNDINAKNIIEILALLNFCQNDNSKLIKEYDKIKKLSLLEKEKYISKLIKLLQNNYLTYYKLFSLYSHSKTSFIIEISKIRQECLSQIFNQIYFLLIKSNFNYNLEVANLKSSVIKHFSSKNETIKLECESIISLSNLIYSYYQDNYLFLFLNQLSYLLKDIKINQEFNFTYQALNKFYIFIESMVIYNQLASLDLINCKYSKLAYFISTNLQIADIFIDFNSQPYPDNEIKELYNEHFKVKYKVTYKEFKANLKNNLIYFLTDKPISYLEFMQQNISSLKQYKNINLSSEEILTLYKLSEDFNSMDKDIINIEIIKSKFKYIIPYILQTIINIAESYKKDINNGQLKNNINLLIQQFKILLDIELSNSNKHE